MKYFFDTEFIEGFKKPMFGKNRHFIDLISIGIVCEDGREYYAVSTDFNAKQADDWVKKNVISKLPERIFNGSNVQQAKLWKSNECIAYDIFRFIHEPVIKKYDDNILFAEEIVKSAYEQGEQPHEFYGYYSDYDWVLFCSLFGRMIDLPKGFPMYCRDLKQMLDDKAIAYFEGVNPGGLNFEERLSTIKIHPKYPKQSNEHNALDDAKWNLKLFEFIQQCIV